MPADSPALTTMRARQVDEQMDPGYLRSLMQPGKPEALRAVALDALEGNATAAEVQAVLHRTNGQAGSAPSGEGTTNAASSALPLLTDLLDELRQQQPHELTLTQRVEALEVQFRLVLSVLTREAA